MLFVFMPCLLVINAVCLFIYYIASCAGLLIGWLSYFNAHTVIAYEMAMSSVE